MAYGDDARYQYLEALDSSRVVWPGAEAAEDAPDAELHLQVFTEVLMTLVLGREVVVPQTYAFDSYGFLRVASTVLRARQATAAGEHPFRLHLFGAHSYDEAAAAMLGRAVDGTRPFMSRLLPELNSPAAHGLDPDEVRHQATGIDRLLNAEWLGTERAEGIALIRDEFRRVPRVAARPVAGRVALGALVVAAAAAAATAEAAEGAEGAEELPEQHREVRAALATAIRRLGTERPEYFDDRSRLRLPLPWPGDAAGRTPEEIVGGPGPLALLIGFVDTLYNLVVVDSIGVADSTLTTGTATGSSLNDLADHGIAQELALAHHRALTRPPASPPAPAPPGAVERADAPPLFEVRVDAAGGLSSGGTRTRLAALQADATDAITALLAARAERGRTARSPFWKGVEELRAASDPVAARKALDAHLTRVAALLGNRVTVAPAAGLAVELVLTAAGAVGPAMAAEVWNLPGTVGYPAMAVGAVSTVLYRRGKDTAVRRLTTRRLACALGRVVDVRS